MRVELQYRSLIVGLAAASHPAGAVVRVNHQTPSR
jgi:hypothetical protein